MGQEKLTQWSSTGSLNFGRHGATATLLPNGQVLIAAGTTITELYNPSTGKFTETAILPVYVGDTAAVLLTNGAVLLPAGYNPGGQEGLAWLNTALLYR